MTVYLIGGPPKCGKTTLAKQLSQQTGIPWISADTLQNIAAAYLPQTSYATHFPHSVVRRGKTNDQFYTEYTSEVIVERYIAQGKTSYPAIRMMAETYITDMDDIIIEGYQVTPEIVHEIRTQYGDEQIRAVFVGKHDEKKFLTDIYRSTTPNDWIIKKTTNSDTIFPKIAQMIVHYASYFEAEAEIYSCRVYDMDTDFLATIEQAVAYLMQNE